MKLTTNQKGEIAKLKVELRAAQKGWISSRTVEGSPYDLILDDNGKLYRIQVKYGGGKTSNSNGSAIINLRRTNGNNRNEVLRRTKDKTYSTKEIDAILAYIPQIDQVVWLPVEKWKDKKVACVRFLETKNNQQKNITTINQVKW